MKHVRWQALFGAALLLLSAGLYLVHYLIFRDAHHIWIYLLGDIAFVPVEVLLVTLILHELLSRREKRAKLGKMNMVIGTFFSEVGAELLGRLARLDEAPEQVVGELGGVSEWSDRDFARAVGRPGVRACRSPEPAELSSLKDLLAGKRDFLLRLLANPNLLEHDRFTNLLWSVFHLTEELVRRPRLDGLPASDVRHLAGDIRRAYERLVTEWLSYMRHLRADYPYLFSLACRTNPLDPDASPVVAQTG